MCFEGNLAAIFMDTYLISSYFIDPNPLSLPSNNAKNNFEVLVYAV